VKLAHNERRPRGWAMAQRAHGVRARFSPSGGWRRGRAGRFWLPFGFGLKDGRGGREAGLGTWPGEGDREGWQMGVSAVASAREAGIRRTQGVAGGLSRVPTGWNRGRQGAVGGRCPGRWGQCACLGSGRHCGVRGAGLSEGFGAGAAVHARCGALAPRVTAADPADERDWPLMRCRPEAASGRRTISRTMMVATNRGAEGRCRDATA